MAGLLQTSKDMLTPLMKKTGETPKGMAGFDNPRDTIDQHLVVKSIDTNELKVARKRMGGTWLNNVVTSGQHYPDGYFYTAGTITLNADRIKALPFFVASPISIDALSVRTTTASAGSLMDFAIYEDNGATYPGNKTAAEVLGLNTGGTTGLKTGTFTAVTLSADSLYWFVYQTSELQAVMRSLRTGATNIVLGDTDGTDIVSGFGGVLTGTRTYDGTLPQSFPAGETVTNEDPIAWVFEVP